MLENGEVVTFGCIVNEIDYSSDTSPVSVSCADGSLFQANFVVVTAPIPVLRRGDIAFVPPLDDRHQEAIDNTRYYPGLKVFLKFNTKFYHDAFALASDFRNTNHDTGDRYFWDEAQDQPTDQQILGFFAVGTLAEAYIALSDDEIIDSLLEELDMMYDDQATPAFVDAVVQNWSTEQYIAGAYSNFKNYNNLERLRVPIGANGQVLFAGEGVPYIDYEHGFVHGAALSGRSVADHILGRINGDVDAGTVPGSSAATTVWSLGLVSIFGWIFVSL